MNSSIKKSLTHLIQKIYNKNNSYKWVFAWISAIIVFPLIKPGFILTLDMIFSPNMVIFKEIELTKADYLWKLFISILNIGIPSWLIQKILIWLVFFIAGIGAYKLIPSKETLGKYYAGIFYAINPFVYSRIMAGHLKLLLAYALLPFVLKFSIKLFKEKTAPWQSLKMVLLLTITATLSEHIAYIGLSILGIVFLANIFSIKKIKSLFKKIYKATLVAGSFLVINFIWIKELFSSTSTDPTFGIDGKAAFATSTNPGLSNIVNLLSLHGFWAEQTNWGKNIIWTKTLIPQWEILLFIILFFAIAGIYYGLKSKKTKKLTLATLILLSIGLFLASGSNSEITKILNDFLSQNIPLFIGFRDPQKWSALIALSISLLGGIGINKLLKLNDKILFKKPFKIISIALIIIYSIPIFLLGTQLTPVNYPSSWHEAKILIEKDKTNGKVLFLPWHLYMSFEFTNNRIVSNPADNFFGPYIIQGDNLELFPIRYTPSNSDSKKIYDFLKEEKTDAKLKELISELNISYIIYANDIEDIDEVDYSFLEKSNSIKRIFQKENLTIYEPN